MGMREIIIRMKLVGFSKGDIHKKMGMKWGLINYFSANIHPPILHSYFII
jgi:hypothetical protein